MLRQANQSSEDINVVMAPVAAPSDHEPPPSEPPPEESPSEPPPEESLVTTGRDVATSLVTTDDMSTPPRVDEKMDPVVEAKLSPSEPPPEESPSEPPPEDSLMTTGRDVDMSLMTTGREVGTTNNMSTPPRVDEQMDPVDHTALRGVLTALRGFSTKNFNLFIAQCHTTRSVPEESDVVDQDDKGKHTLFSLSFSLSHTHIHTHPRLPHTRTQTTSPHTLSLSHSLCLTQNPQQTCLTQNLQQTLKRTTPTMTYGAMTNF
jgi:hypothetical protein